MKVHSIKLKGKGKDGITLIYEDPTKRQNGVTEKVGHTIDRKLPIPKSLQNSIARLQLHFLTLTGHFIPEYSEFVDFEEGGLINKAPEGDKLNTFKNLTNLLEKTTITGISTGGKSEFVITGFIKTHGKRGCAINTPLLKPVDEAIYGRFFDAVELINEIFEDCKRYVLSEESMADSKQLLLEYADDMKNQDKAEEFKSHLSTLDDKGMDQELMKYLERKGHIILDSNNDDEEEIEQVPDDLEIELKSEGKVVDMKPKGKEEKKEEVEVPPVEGNRRNGTTGMANDVDDDF